MHRILLFLLLTPLTGAAQITQIFDDEIKSLSLAVDERPAGSMPVITLDGGERLHVSFDRMGHEYIRYGYRIEHLDRDFRSENGLFVSDYVHTDTDWQIIENYATTTNTSVPYTHYAFTLPSSGLRPLLSGNYRLEIVCEDDTGENIPVVETYFYVIDPKVSIRATATTDTEVDRDETHQGLGVSVDFSRLAPRDATAELGLVVLKNGRWNDAVRYPRPTAETGRELLWEHSRELTFSAGNEFRKFEMPSTRYPGMYVDDITLHAGIYHATLIEDAPRRNYLYDEDQNGRYRFRAEGGRSAETDADYLVTHFTLDAKNLPSDLNIYIDGEWTHHAFIPRYRMEYDVEGECYHLALLLKQGYYSYQYVCVSPEGGVSTAQPVEGDYWQTENEYTLLVYYRPAGARYDRLVGYRTASYRP